MNDSNTQLPPHYLRPTILIVDDIAENRKLLASLIRQSLQCKIIMAKTGDDALRLFSSTQHFLPNLILLDVMMPGMDGFETAKKIRMTRGCSDIPILFITAMNSAEDKIRAFKAGGVDFISKPFNQYELLARVEVHLQLQMTREQLKEKNRLLEDKSLHLKKLVNEKTKEIESLNLCMVSALENANTYNDTDTGYHIRRVANYSEFLAEKAGLSPLLVNKIKLYSPLHDIGKVGIPDRILKKPDIYTPEEFELMKQHVTIGAEMLNSEGFDEVARNITLYHHEKWNGSGYLHGLKGEDIPIEARIVALADVYDALSTKRSYKDAFSQEKTDEIIKKEAGEHFDPRLVDVFFSNRKQFIAISERLTAS